MLCRTCVFTSSAIYSSRSVFECVQGVKYQRPIFQGRVGLVWTHKKRARTSVPKFDRTRKTGPHQSRRFLKNLAKISENQQNSAETHRRRRRNSENREHRNATGFTNKLAVFSKNRCGEFRAVFCRKPTDFCRNSVNGTKKP
jgi:hypothetical protein